MFVPSESVYAELHDGFDDVVQKAFRAKVVIVSPSLLMLAIQVVQQIQKDARMREAADQIRDEVGRLMKDVSLLGDRVRKLQTHFNQSNEDMRQSHDLDREDREARRAHQQVEFDGETAAAAEVIAAPVRKLRSRGVAADGRVGLSAGRRAATRPPRRWPTRLRSISSGAC